MRAALCVMVLLGWAILCGTALAETPAPPKAALKYQRQLIRDARYVWGINAPVAVFAAQIHQESAWKERAQSPFAAGLAQFTPSTAVWISGAYPDELGGGDPYNPAWAIKALVRYDLHLWQRIMAANDCERMAFTLSAYNGGAGWVTKDKLLAANNGADNFRWFGNVENYTKRAGWAKKENRAYPRRILLLHQPIYKSWGMGIDCGYVGSN